MKKWLMLLIVMISLFVSSCGFFETELREIEDEITLSIKEDFIEYLGYEEKDIPTYTFEFEGKINITLRNTGPNEIIFSGNDDFRISEMVEEFLKYHEENGIISYRTLNVQKKYETHLNKRTVLDDGTVKTERVYLKVTDGDLHNEIAYITLDNGLQLTMNFCRFEGEINGVKKTYYAWQYSESIRLILYYPLMVVDDKNVERKILIVALPNKVINKIEPRYDVKGLMTKDTYLDSSYYTYPYPDYDEETSSSDYDPSDSINNIKNYYIERYNGRYEGEDFVYTYLGYDFKVEFYNTNFVITFIAR